MKGNAKKFLALFLICAFVALVAGCGTTTSSTTASTTAKPGTTSAATTTAAGGLPIVSKPLTLSLFISPPDTRLANSLGDLDTVKAIEAKTGITINFKHPSATDKGEAMSTMLASGQYTDMIRSNFSTYKGGLEGAINDKIVIDFTSLVKQYAVNYNKLVADNKMEKLVMTDTGKETGFGSTFSPNEFINKSFSGLVIRQDWLTELGLAMPVTVDDWYNVLKAFKEKKNCQAPLGLCGIFSTTEMVRAQAFVGSYGAAYTFLLSSDQVKYGPILPEFKTFLQTFSKWYAEGLINKDIATHDYTKNIKPMFANGQVGATLMHPSQFPVIYEMVDKTKNPAYKIMPAPYPQVVKGQECPYRHNHLGVNINPIMVSTTCKNPVEAIKFVDFLYSKEGIDMCTWGVEEGQTYIKNTTTGLRSLGPKITKNPDGLGVQDARYKFTGGYLQMQWNWEYEQQQYTMEEQKASTWNLWSATNPKNYIPEVISMTADETTAYTTAMSQVDPYAQEMILKFIMGVEPLTSYDKFVSTIKSMGIEKAEKAKQAAYDRYKKR